MTTPAPHQPVLAPPAALPPADGAWHGLDALDRAWAGVYFTRSIARFDVPSAEHVGTALLALARTSPEIGRWVTADQLRWRPVGPDEWQQWLGHAFAVAPVTEADADLERIAVLNDERPRWTQFRVLVGADWVSLRAYHSFADGWTADAFLGALLTRAGSSSGSPSDEPVEAPWTVFGQRRRDRVVARALRRHPRTVLRAVRARNDLAGGVYEPIGPDLAPGRERVLEVSSPADFPARLRALRDELYPGVSAAAVGIVAMRAALASVLPDPRPGFECLFNTRNADAGTQAAWGNFSAGVYIRPADDTDPRAVAAEMKQVRDSGLPELAHASLRFRRRTAAPEIRVAGREGAPRLTMSYMSAHNIDPVIPGLRVGESRVQAITRPNGAESITVQQVECAGRIHVGLAFFPHVWDATLIESAVARFFADPRRFLAPVARTGAP